MPTVSVYIKNDDWEAWRKLEKPSEFIHNALNRSVRSDPGFKRIEKVDERFALKPPGELTRKQLNEQNIKRANAIDEKIEVTSPDLNKVIPVSSGRLSNGLCKIHGTPLDDRGRCMVKGCKYS